MNYSGHKRPGPSKGSWGNEIPYFRQILGWWNIRIWPEIWIHVSVSMSTTFIWILWDPSLDEWWRDVLFHNERNNKNHQGQLKSKLLVVSTICWKRKSPKKKSGGKDVQKKLCFFCGEVTITITTNYSHLGVKTKWPFPKKNGTSKQSSILRDLKNMPKKQVHSLHWKGSCWLAG